ncbi:MAG: photosystem I assembly protein Ycf4 [Cyanobacteriota bacterium]|nr:MAG: photosystem I assembly protein Ycf4 [Cyanobacteriota bacterium]
MIDSSEVQKPELIRRYIVVGSRRFSNYWWASVILLGGFGFLLTGISSYLSFNLLPFINEKNILFFPQGLVMCFYGILGLIFSCYLWLTIFWGVGGGFNEFNKRQGIVRIFRWGFPGKNRRIDLSYDIKDIEAIRVEIKEGLNPRRILYIRVKGNTTVSNPVKDNENLLPASNDKKLSINPVDSSLMKGKKNVVGITKNLSLQNKRDIPLTRIGQPTTLEDIEKQAAELAKFLQVSLEMI